MQDHTFDTLTDAKKSTDAQATNVDTAVAAVNNLTQK